MAFSRGEGAVPALVGHFMPEDKAKFYLPRMQAAASRATIERFERVLGESTAGSAIGRLADLDFQTYLTDDINVKVDIASMAHALEVRCPYLDTEVVEFAAGFRPACSCALTANTCFAAWPPSLIPEPILRRRKRGFGLPLKRWLRHDLRPLMHDMLLDPTARERGLFDPAYVAGLIARWIASPSMYAGSDVAYARALVSRIHRCAAFDLQRAAKRPTDRRLPVDR